MTGGSRMAGISAASGPGLRGRFRSSELWSPAFCFFRADWNSPSDICPMPKMQEVSFDAAQLAERRSQS